MPITFGCACGKQLRVADEYAGRRVKCPACGGATTVPEPEPEFEVIEDPSEPIAAPPPPKARPVAKPTARRRADDDDDDYDDEERPRKKKKWKKPKKRPAAATSSGDGGSGGVAGGLLMMVGAVVWFVVGLAFDWVFFYPPILFILGLVAFVKGLAGNSE